MKMQIEPPKNMGINRIDVFLRDIEFVFKNNPYQQEDFKLNLTNLKEVSILGAMVLYKFISYTVEKKCFFKPEIEISKDKNLPELFNSYGFYDSINVYITSRGKSTDIEKSISKFHDHEESGKLLITPQKLIRSEENQKNILEAKLFEKINKFYPESDINNTVSECIGELMSNFWSHATEDSGTIMVAQCKRNLFEICFADNGNGIISTLKSGCTEFKNLKDEEVLKKSLEQGVTSKPKSNHMGFGLYMIKKICENNNGNLIIHSENAKVILYPGKHDVKTTKSAYWKGTIIYLQLGLDKIVPISKIPELNVKENNIYKKINWS